MTASPERVRLVDDSAQFLESELAGQYVGADGHAPPLVMIFTMSAPRSALSRTARRSSCSPLAAPPIDQQ